MWISWIAEVDLSGVGAREQIFFFHEVKRKVETISAWRRTLIRSHLTSQVDAAYLINSREEQPGWSFLAGVLLTAVVVQATLGN